jgi:hypothetical protein
MFKEHSLQRQTGAGNRRKERAGYRIRVFAPPGIGGEAGRAGDAGEDYSNQNCTHQWPQKGIPL